MLTGYDNLVYSLQWQVSKDGETFLNIDGATSLEYVTAVTEENVNDYWRVEINITSIIE